MRRITIIATKVVPSFRCSLAGHLECEASSTFGPTFRGLANEGKKISKVVAETSGGKTGRNFSYFFSPLLQIQQKNIKRNSQ